MTRSASSLYASIYAAPHPHPIHPLTYKPYRQARGKKNEAGDETEDYMSEAFLAQLEQQQQRSASRTIGRKRPQPSSGSGAPAPALAPPLSRKAKQQQAEEKLQEGLTTPLPEVRRSVAELDRLID